MSLASTAQGALAVIAGLVPEAAVTVVSDNVSVTGIRATTQDATSGQALGEMGMSTNLVRVSAAALTAVPARGTTILVDEERVFVTMARLDPSGGILTIEYSKQQPADTL